ncbi:MAG: Asp23/Gls24 family envelope stress response protein [Candidatus Omnitrophota bacterium]|jgi:uncharacterized alkaline shock family protein YloU|nr:Asp23/Gls24 family envelope stress response protein [Candidatus Omnitrophota bacterium]
MNTYRKSDLGMVQVQDTVIAEIVALTIKNLPSVRIAEDDWIRTILEFFGKKIVPGVQVTVNDHEVSLEIKILVAYGQNIPHMAKVVQDAVREALGKAGDINLKEININVLGIDKSPARAGQGGTP